MSHQANPLRKLSLPVTAWQCYRNPGPWISLAGIRTTKTGADDEFVVVTIIGLCRLMLWFTVPAWAIQTVALGRLLGDTRNRGNPILLNLFSLTNRVDFTCVDERLLTQC